MLVTAIVLLLDQKNFFLVSNLFVCFFACEQ